MTTKDLKRVILAATAALAAVTIPSALAVEGSPNRPTRQARPDGWGCNGNCQADSNADNINHAYPQSGRARSYHTLVPMMTWVMAGHRPAAQPMQVKTSTGQARHAGHTQNRNLWTATTEDFHDSGSGYWGKEETDRLELCHGAC